MLRSIQSINTKIKTLSKYNNMQNETLKMIFSNGVYFTASSILYYNCYSNNKNMACIFGIITVPLVNGVIEFLYKKDNRINKIKDFASKGLDVIETGGNNSNFTKRQFDIIRPSLQIFCFSCIKILILCIDTAKGKIPMTLLLSGINIYLMTYAYLKLSDTELSVYKNLYKNLYESMTTFINNVIDRVKDTKEDYEREMKNKKLEKDFDDKMEQRKEQLNNIKKENEKFQKEMSKND